MKRLLNSLNPIRNNYHGVGIIETIDAIFNVVDEQQMKPFYPQMKSEIKTFLLRLFTEYEYDDSIYLAECLGENKFMQFIVGITLEFLDESINNKMRPVLYSFFESLIMEHETKMTAFLPKIVPPMIASVQTNNTDHVRNVYREKEKAISALKSLASLNWAEFKPYYQTSFDAIFGQLTSSEDAIRKNSIETLTEICWMQYQSKSNWTLATNGRQNYSGIRQKFWKMTARWTLHSPSSLHIANYWKMQ